MIKVKNLHKKFNDLMVLNGIDEHISQGEVVVIIGPSGSGKSTFLRCLNLLEDVTEGEIYVDDELINAPKANINVIRQKMGMVFQQFNLFPHLTIMKNITLAPVLLKRMTKEEAVRKGRELLERVNLAEKADAYPAQLSAGSRNGGGGVGRYERSGQIRDDDGDRYPRDGFCEGGSFQSAFYRSGRCSGERHAGGSV